MTDYAEGGLDGAIEDAIDAFRTKREWEFASVDDGEGLKLIGVIAGLISTASRDLAPADGWNDPSLWKRLRRLVNQPDMRSGILEELQIELAWEHAPTTRSKAERLLEITAEVLPRQPDELVLKYLQRLIGCYVAGLFPESLMVCGAVLEQEIKATFKRKRIPLPVTPKGKSPMNTRIAAAHTFGWLTSEGKKRAVEVWERRNKTTHEDPLLVKQAAETVRLTILVLQELGAVK